jgi:hypothetical protein
MKLEDHMLIALTLIFITREIFFRQAFVELNGEPDFKLAEDEFLHGVIYSGIWILSSSLVYLIKSAILMMR